MTPHRITSKNNAYVKHIRSLNTRKSRKKTSEFLIEGIHQVGMAVEANFPLESILYAPELLTSTFAEELVSDISRSQIKTIEVSADVFNSFAAKENPQGLAAIGRQVFAPISEISKTQGIWVALEEIQDPGNLGSIMRTMDAVGADRLNFNREHCRPLSSRQYSLKYRCDFHHKNY